MMCNDCKYAEWRRNVKGHLHPSKEGKCTYYKKVLMPASATSQPYTRDMFIEIKGGWIERDKALREPCVYYGATK